MEQRGINAKRVINVLSSGSGEKLLLCLSRLTRDVCVSQQQVN